MNSSGIILKCHAIINNQKDIFGGIYARIIPNPAFQRPPDTPC